MADTSKSTAKSKSKGKSKAKAKGRTLTDGALTAMELAAIDLAIIAKQTAGVTIGPIRADDDDDEAAREARFEQQAAMAEARAEAAQARWEARHSGLGVDLTDAAVLKEITRFSAQLSKRTSLAALVAIRGEVLAGPG